MFIRLFFSTALLGVLVWVVSKSVDLHTLPAVILSFPKLQLFILLLISFLISTLKAWRFKWLLSSNNIHLKFWDNLKVFIASQALTPLPGGEVVRGILIKKETKTSLSKASGPVVALAYSEVVAASFVALLGSLYFQMLRIPVLILLVILFILGYLLLNRHIFLKVINKLPESVAQKLINITKFQKEFEDTLKSSDNLLPNREFFRSLGIALLTNLLGGMIVLFIAKAYNVDLNFLQSIFLYALSIIITTVGSISPGGLGLTEGGLTGVLLLFNVEVTKAIAIVLIFRIITLVFSVVIGLIFLTMFYGKSLIFSNKVLAKNE